MFPDIDNVFWSVFLKTRFKQTSAWIWLVHPFWIIFYFSFFIFLACFILNTTLSAFFMQIFLSFLKDGWFIDVLGWKVYYFWYFSNKISSEVFYERWGLGLDRQSTLIIRFLWQLFIFLDFGWDFGVQLFYLYDSISWRQIEVIYGLFCLICSYIFFLFVVASSVLFFDNKWYSSSSVTHSTGLESFNLLSLKDP